MKLYIPRLNEQSGTINQTARLSLCCYASGNTRSYMQLKKLAISKTLILLPQAISRYRRIIYLNLDSAAFDTFISQILRQIGYLSARYNNWPLNLNLNMSRLTCTTG